VLIGSRQRQAIQPRRNRLLYPDDAITPFFQAAVAPTLSHLVLHVPSAERILSRNSTSRRVQRSCNGAPQTDLCFPAQPWPSSQQNSSQSVTESERRPEERRRRLTSTFPLGIFLINVAGSVLIGGIAGGLASGRVALSYEARTFLIVGVLGGFTTFSSFSLDTFTLFRAGHTAQALGNVGGQVLLSLVGVWIGFGVGTRI
jgi:CrcB protein